MEPRLFEVCRLMVEIPGNWDLTPQPMGGGVTNPAALPPPHFGPTVTGSHPGCSAVLKSGIKSFSWKRKRLGRTCMGHEGLGKRCLQSFGTSSSLYSQVVCVFCSISVLYVTIQKKIFYSPGFWVTGPNLDLLSHVQ